MSLSTWAKDTEHNQSCIYKPVRTVTENTNLSPGTIHGSLDVDLWPLLTCVSEVPTLFVASECPLM